MPLILHFINRTKLNSIYQCVQVHMVAQMTLEKQMYVFI